jgi:hypothetical protein
VSTTTTTTKNVTKSNQTTQKPAGAITPLSPPTSKRSLPTRGGEWSVDKLENFRLQCIEKMNITHQKIASDQEYGWWTSPVGGCPPIKYHHQSGEGGG